MSLQVYRLSSDGKFWKSAGRMWIPTNPFPYGDYGTYKPDASTSGYTPTGTSLVTYPSSGGPAGPITNGVLVLNVPGTILTGYDFPCRILVNAANCQVLKSRVRGGTPPTTNTALVDCHNAACVNFNIEDSKIIPDNPGIWTNALIGHDYTASRNDWSLVVDGAGIYNTQGPNANVALYGNYAHDASFFSPDPNHSGDPSPSSTHNDILAQIQGGFYIIIKGNNAKGFASETTLSRDGTAGADILRAAAGSGSTGPNSLGGYNRHFPNLLGVNTPNKQVNSVIQVTSNVSPVGYVLMDYNFSDGGFYCWNIAATLTNSRATFNKFGHGSAGDSGTPDIGDDHTHTIVGGGSAFQAASHDNTYENNGHPIQMR